MTHFVNKKSVYYILALFAGLAMAFNCLAGVYYVVDPYLSFVNDPRNSIMINWIIEADPSEGAYVYWDTSPPVSPYQSEYVSPGSQWAVDEKYYHYEISGLDPGIIYEYRVESDNSTIDTEWTKFTTAPQSFSDGDAFVIYGDSRSGYVSGQPADTHHPEIVYAFMDHEDGPPMFIFHVGDIAIGPDEGDAFGEWKYDFFNPLNSLTDYYGQIENHAIDTRPLLISIGNHEVTDEEPTNTTLYENTFEFPKNGSGSQEELYYSFDYGQVHITVLNSEVFLKGGEPLIWTEAYWQEQLD